MAQRSLRFGIHDSKDRRAATWKLWTDTGSNKSDIYLACRSLGGTSKASLHESGNWHIAYSQSVYEEKVRGTIQHFKDRFIEKWSRPSEIALGFTLAFRIVTPCSAITSSKEGRKFKDVIWLTNAPEQKATEIDIIITKPATPVAGWPGKQSMGTSLIGSFPLENGDIVWAVCWIIDMPDFSRLGKRVGRFYKGKGKEDLKAEGLRALAFGTEPDGSRTIYDCAVKAAATQNPL